MLIQSGLTIIPNNMAKFLEQYDKEYKFLYENDNVAGYDEAVTWFDEMKNNAEVLEYLFGYISLRGDFISSDREAGAFAFACAELGIG